MYCIVLHCTVLHCIVNKAKYRFKTALSRQEVMVDLLYKIEKKTEPLQETKQKKLDNDNKNSNKNIHNKM